MPTDIATPYMKKLWVFFSLDESRGEGRGGGGDREPGRYGLQEGRVGSENNNETNTVENFR